MVFREYRVGGNGLEKYFLTLYLRENYTAGSKAKIDVEHFLYQHDFKKMNLYNGTGKLSKLITFFKKLYNLPFNKKEKVILVTHYPLLNPMILKIFIKILKLRKYNITLIGIIHDIDTLRYQQDHDAIRKEIEILNMFDYLVSHNSAMTRWLVNQGFKGKIQELELFDYKVDNKKNTEGIKIMGPEKELEERKYVISFAGNLDLRKSGFIYFLDTLDSSNLLFYLYGPNFNASQVLKENIKYKGVYESDVLPICIEGDWGLIWDGDSIKTCSSETGNYLRYNTPHKLSLYIVGGLPVIVWNEAAVSEIVKKYNIGIMVNSLEEVSKKLSNMTAEEYQQYKKNVLMLAEKLKKGEFIIGTFNKIIKTIEEV